MSSYEKFVKKYNDMRRKHANLPEAEKLNFEFELENGCKEFDSEISFPLRFARRCIFNFFSYLLNYLHDIIRPNPQSAVLMEEFKCFDEKEKDEIVKLIARIMGLLRKNTKFLLIHDDKEEAELISSAYAEWMAVKKSLNPLIKKNIEFWEHYTAESK